MDYCDICGREMNNPEEEDSMNCGGTCWHCMREAGDPEDDKESE